MGTKPRARSIQPNFPEISVQNSMDRFGPTGKVSKKRVHLLRWSSFPGRTGWNFGWMDRALKTQSPKTKTRNPKIETKPKQSHKPKTRYSSSPISFELMPQSFKNFPRLNNFKFYIFRLIQNTVSWTNKSRKVRRTLCTKMGWLHDARWHDLSDAFHVTLTLLAGNLPVCRRRAFPTAERDGFNRAAIHVLCFAFISS